MYDGSIVDVEKIEVGHAWDENGGTGCTVILCRDGAVAGVDVRGSAPGTRETDLLNPINLVQEVHGIILCGGSAFGLAAADGVMEYLEEQDIGFDTGAVKVPIVPAAVLFDLSYGDPNVRPDRRMGYRACEVASNKKVEQGSVGAGAGATVGKLLGMENATKGGIGTASIKLAGGIVVGAIVAVNAFGDVVHVDTRQIIGGARHPDTGEFIDTTKNLISANESGTFACQNTTIGVVATNAKLTKGEANKLASMTHDGYALAIRPVHTMFDGDTIFALSTGDVTGDINVIGTASVYAMAYAINNAIWAAMPTQ
ncbi:MAG TPA: P1 family peptidase [Clostridiales bacterium]|nr:P1 family peptidase [Clostridiales bacterium]